MTVDEQTLSIEAVDADWQYLWSQFGDFDFCREYWDKYVAVFEGQIVGVASTDTKARQAALERLSREGKEVPTERFCVDFVGD